MYEKPELTRVGDAEETILGPCFDGGDIDMNWSTNPTEFEIESIPFDK
jgi:hypothetical protein